MLKATRLTKLFSSVARIAKSQGKDDIRALQSLLKDDSKFSLNTVTEQEKDKYIKSFTTILNSQIDLAGKPDLNYHFNQSILGLNNILNNTKLDSASLKTKILNASSEEELIGFFDILISTQQLTMFNFKLILFDPKFRSLQHALDKLEFLNSNGELDYYKIMIASKAFILKDFSLSKKLYDENIASWNSLRDEGKLNRFDEKTLYQLIYRITRDYEQFHRFSFNNYSYTLLIESLPKLIKNLQFLQEELKLSRNQELFVRFINYLNGKPNTGNSIRRLIKLSSTNQICKEIANEDEILTVHKYKFINGLSDMSDGLVQKYGSDDKELTRLVAQIHKSDDFLQNETALKFI